MTSVFCMLVNWHTQSFISLSSKVFWCGLHCGKTYMVILFYKPNGKQKLSCLCISNYRNIVMAQIWQQDNSNYLVINAPSVINSGWMKTKLHRGTAEKKQIEFWQLSFAVVSLRILDFHSWHSWGFSPNITEYSATTSMNSFVIIIYSIILYIIYSQWTLMKSWLLNISNDKTQIKPY